MAAELIPIRLSITAGDLYTLWAPRWRDSGDEWEGFLGKDENVFAFASVADLAAFVRTDSDNDLAEHPAWEAMTRANAHRLQPAEDRQADLIAVAEQLAEKPSEDSVGALANTLAVVSSLGSVCELPTVTRFFNGNPNLGLVTGGLEQFTGRAGRKRWDTVGEIVARGWDGVLSAIDEIVVTPDVDDGVAAAAADELAEPFDGEDDLVVAAEIDDDEDGGGAIAGIGALGAASLGTASLGSTALGATSLGMGKNVVLGGDAHFWENVGIDPVRVMTSGGTFFTLRCYYDDRPRFLGRNGRISVFGSERALARYLADEHDHDLADLSTYDDIRTAATDGSLRVDVIEDNVYVLTASPTTSLMVPMRPTANNWHWPSSLSATSAPTQRTTPSTSCWPRTPPSGPWSITSWTRTPRPAPPRPMPPRRGNGRTWRGSWSPGSAASSE